MGCKVWGLPEYGGAVHVSKDDDTKVASAVTVSPNLHLIRGGIVVKVVSLNCRFKGLLGPVSGVIKKKKKTRD